jgi:hypothetical protein
MSVLPFDLDHKSKAEFRIFMQQFNLPAKVEEDVATQVNRCMSKVTKRLMVAPYQDAMYLTMMHGKHPKVLKEAPWDTSLPTVFEYPWDQDGDFACNIIANP